MHLKELKGKLSILTAQKVFNYFYLIDEALSLAFNYLFLYIKR